VFPVLYPILDAGADPASIVPLAETLAGAGATLLQFRAKRATPPAVFEVARELSSQLAARGIKIIVNDRPDIALLSGAAGVHLGQEDISVEEARRICGYGMWVGVSTHNIKQLRLAEGTSADYIAVGPIFPTGTKENPDPVVGLEFLLAARTKTKKPLVAIGGITVESAEQVYRAGADSIAVIRDLSSAADPAARFKEYLRIAARARASRS